MAPIETHKGKKPVRFQLESHRIFLTNYSKSLQYEISQNRGQWKPRCYLQEGRQTDTREKKLICNFCNFFVNMYEQETQMFSTARMITIASQPDPLHSLKNNDKYTRK